MTLRNILIVEDDPIFAMDLADMAWEAGCTPIGPAHCLQGALELASRHPIDLAVIDVNLSDGRTGLAVARLVQEQYGVRTIVLSGELPDPSALKAHEHVFVRKPVPPHVIREILAARPVDPDHAAAA
ncbi:response regulator [Oharaeibacter diazotrophicus]|uniref:Response regulator receiver domain-containing protein n=1 Tax=Oharaeibacter diazotrophicus TaxID=1920512 RepID=A0A4R6R8V8_9HYPH|nr:response regulator [Oharaeibacter diazotrophicus]TDP82399.1 response regulator receiver domain-containing protein [Oharaeibacter diazotrophicus]BBE72838.1 putative transcriptional regulatory protein pdtaR [Pleomorphomonas sp. SM30]GLS76877.1 hypothetical protein GCM10007904_22140 [Oharaeibacter diazotrophicus]